MARSRPRRSGGCGDHGRGAGASPSFAQAGAPPQAAFRPEIAAPLQAAEELIRAKKFDEALARIRLTDAVADRTANENLAIDRMRGIAAAGAGDIPTATRSFEAVIAAGRLEPADRARMVEVLAQLHFQAKDYPKAATLGSAIPEGWRDERGDALAADPRRTISPTIARARRASCARSSMPTRKPGRRRSSSGCSSWRTATPSSATMPDPPSRWKSCSSTIRARNTGPRRSGASRAEPGFAERLRLDVLRLRQATGTLSGTADYVAMAQTRTGRRPAGRGETDFRSGASLPVRSAAGADAEQRRLARHGRETDGRRTRSSSRRAPRPPLPRATGPRSSTSASPT